MRTTPKPLNIRRLKRQGQLLAFSMTGAMALALTACDNSSGAGQTMITPPGGFSPNQAVAFTNTNQPPSSPYVNANTSNAPYLGGQGYYPVYGYPGYFYRPAAGSTVQLVTGGSSSYSASSPEEAQASVARGGFGESGGGEGGEGSHGGGGE